MGTVRWVGTGYSVLIRTKVYNKTGFPNVSIKYFLNDRKMAVPQSLVQPFFNYLTSFRFTSTLSPSFLTVTFISISAVAPVVALADL